MANFSYQKNQSAPSPYVGDVDHSAGRFNNSPYVRLSQQAIWDRIQHQRTTYTTSNADTNSPFLSGEISVNWDDQFSDSNYSVLVTVEDPNFSAGSPAVLPPAVLVTSKTKSGVTVRLSFYPFLWGVNRPLIIDFVAIHD